MTRMPSVLRPDLPSGADRAVEALGNRVKLAALRSLVVEGPTTAVELADRLAVSVPLLRKHLAVLEDLEVVSVTPPRSEQDVRRRVWTVNVTVLETLVGDLVAALGLER